MLEFKQIEGSGPPMDIEVVTDDANAEMVEISETLEKGEFSAEDFRAVKNLNDATRDDEGRFRFVVPGDEAGDIGDYWEELSGFLHECNQKAIAAVEEDSAQSITGEQ